MSSYLAQAFLELHALMPTDVCQEKKVHTKYMRLLLKETNTLHKCMQNKLQVCFEVCLF